MSGIEVADEAIAAMWDGLALDLDELAPTEAAAHAFLEVASGHFLDMLRDFPHDVLACVAAPTGGAGKHALVVTISGAFKGRLTRTAKDFHGLTSH